MSSESKAVASHRLYLDYQKILQSGRTDITAKPSLANIQLWYATIHGLGNTPFESGIFKLILVFPDNYPFKPPIVRFVSDMFHPNIYSDGTVCVDILTERWNPIFDVHLILSSVQILLGEPNPESPANVPANTLYLNFRDEYIKAVKRCVAKSIEIENSNK